MRAVAAALAVAAISAWPRGVAAAASPPRRPRGRAADRAAGGLPAAAGSTLSRVRARRTTGRGWTASRCRVAAGTPLARPRPQPPAPAAAARRLRLLPGQRRRRVREGDRPRRRAGGSAASGWVYKVGRRAATAGAGDPTGPFGRGRLRAASGCCGSTAARPATASARWRCEASVGRGGEVTVRVTGYDDNGRGVPVEGATVKLGPTRADRPDADGMARGHARARARYGVTAEQGRPRALLPRAGGRGVRRAGARASLAVTAAVLAGCGLGAGEEREGPRPSCGSRATSAARRSASATARPASARTRP